MSIHRSFSPWAFILLASCSSSSNQTATPATVSPASGTPAATEAGRRVNAIADDYWAGLVQTFPLFALFSGVPNAPNDRIGDNSIAATRAWQKREDGWLNQLHQVHASELKGTPEDATYGGIARGPDLP
jgi:uncharacterized protein (DUF885 family)